jgi:hypothetical protein
VSSIAELTDLRTDYWGNKYNTAGARLRSLDEKVDQLLHNVYPTFDDEDHSSARVYEQFTFVHDSNNNTYVSLKRVPAGILIDNTEYWKKWDVCGDYVERRMEDVFRVEGTTLVISAKLSDE